MNAIRIIRSPILRFRPPNASTIRSTRHGESLMHVLLMRRELERRVIRTVGERNLIDWRTNAKWLANECRTHAIQYTTSYGRSRYIRCAFAFTLGSVRHPCCDRSTLRKHRFAIRSACVPPVLKYDAASVRLQLKNLWRKREVNEWRTDNGCIVQVAFASSSQSRPNEWRIVTCVRLQVANDW